MIARRSIFATLALLGALAGVLMCWSVAAQAALVHEYLSQLTEVPASSGASVTGPFGHPWGLAFGAGGELYVADNTSGVIDEFDSSGSFVSPQIGGGVLSHQFGRDVAVNHVTGEVYVADSQLDVVYAFSAAGALLETWHGTDTPSGSFGGGYVHVTVDNSTSLSDPAAGEVYVSDTSHKVVDVLEPEAGGKEKYLTQLTGVGVPGGFALPFELAVDEASGELLVANTQGVVNVFLPVLGGYEYVSQLTGPPGGSFGEIGGVAVEASSGEIYVADTGAKVVDQFSATGVFEGQITGPAVAAFAEPLGVAVTEGGDVYVADGSVKAVEVFGPDVVVPDVTVGSVSGETATGATLSGTVDPDGVAVSACRFEYGTSTSYGQSVPCAQTPAQIGSGSGPVPVGAMLNGLLANTTYHFRLDGSNANGTNFTRDAVFTTAGPPAVDGESFSNVGSIGVDVGAQVNPDGSATTYRFEYGTSTSYGSMTPGVSLGDTRGDIAAAAQLSGLQPDTIYHFRVIASNEYGSVQGADTTFTTSLPTSSSLPDGRAYETVSPVATEGNANIYVPAYLDRYGPFGEHGILTGEPFEVAPDGETVVYPGDPPTAGGGGSSGAGRGDQYLAKRSPGGGWTQTDISPPESPGGQQTLYLAFSSDLSVGVFGSPDVWAAGAPEGDLYSYHTSDGSYQPFFTGTPGPGNGYVFDESIYAGANAGTSGTPEASHLLFEENRVLPGVGGFEEELSEDVKMNTEIENTRRRVLYESVNGKLSVVNVLPNGKADAAATFGSMPIEVLKAYEKPSLSNVISADGSRIFWTDEDTGHIYVRENATSPDAVTVPVDEAVGGGGFFWAASADGSKAFFTRGDLYEYDVNDGMTTDLTPGVEVEGLAGASENGEYIYYVTDSKLNLWHNGASKFIAQLSSLDNSDVDPWKGPENNFGTVGDWQPSLGFRPARVTPDGRDLVFMSREPLTGYDNKDKGQALEEVFLYEADSGELRCVSCNPTGEPPVPTQFDNFKGEAFFPQGALIPITRRPENGELQPRVISDDGSRVFFDSAEPLVPQDSNGWLDVYEWERDGTGSCGESRGCIYLLSGGASSDDSVLLGASASGDDVFIITRAQLLAQDRNDEDDVYDVRVGGVRPPLVPACAGTGCQGVPPAPPIFATPASVTFNGIGNFVPPSPAHAKSTKSKSKPKKCKRGFIKKRGRCVKQKGRKARAKRKGRR